MTLVVVVSLSAPHAGAQAVVVPVVTRLQPTPGIFPSFATEAVNVTAVPPGMIVAIGLVMVTVSGKSLWLCEEQPASARAATAVLTRKRNGLRFKDFLRE